MTDCEERINELEKEVEKLKREINKLKGSFEWYDTELANQQERIKTLEKLLDVYYDKEKQAWRSKFLARIYAMLMKHEKKLFPQQKLKTKP